MTLTEYCGQSSKASTGSVILNANEFKVVGSACSIAKLLAIYIPMFNYTYVKKHDSNVLFTTDEHGNPKSPSVFAIENNINL